MSATIFGFVNCPDCGKLHSMAGSFDGFYIDCSCGTRFVAATGKR